MIILSMALTMPKTRENQMKYISKVEMKVYTRVFIRCNDISDHLFRRYKKIM